MFTRIHSSTSSVVCSHAYTPLLEESSDESNLERTGQSETSIYLGQVMGGAIVFEFWGDQLRILPCPPPPPPFSRERVGEGWGGLLVALAMYLLCIYYVFIII